MTLPTDNPMGSPDYLATYTFHCVVTHRIFHITLRGPYLKAIHEARALVAQQMHVIATREEPDNEVTIAACLARLYGVHGGVEPGTVHVIDTWGVQKQPRSQVALCVEASA